jgi:hypothetical protein
MPGKINIEGCTDFVLTSNRADEINVRQSGPFMINNAKIETKAVTKDKVHLGWKVYIDGDKFPKKPQDFYRVIAEESAITRALRDYRAGGGN